jgi:uridine kinase
MIKENFLVTINNGDVKTVSKDTTLLELSKSYNENALVAKVNNELKGLNKTLVIDSNVEFLDISNPNGFKTYQNSMLFVLIYSIKELMGKDHHIIVDHSIKKDFYCKFANQKIDISDTLLNDISNKMKEVINANIPIEKVSIPKEVALEVSKDLGLYDTVNLIKYIQKDNIDMYKIGSIYNYFNEELATSTSVLKSFKLHKRDNAFLLQFPSKKNIEKFDEIKNLEKISSVFIESNKWAEILNVDTVASLNSVLCNNEIGEIVKVAEALHEKKISNISDMICKEKKNIVLIAGPSSSGKTTFAERLCVQLRAASKAPHLISLDNYFLDKKDAPLDEFGQINLESADFVDIKLLNEDLTKLLKGETVQIPTYNFKLGKREYNGATLCLKENDILVIEGIHGLNERLTSSIPKNKKFKIFISALTQLNIDAHNRIATSDTRLIRRIVRDNQYRGTDPSKTISMWESVTKGESLNIFPYQEDADAFFNSALVYEMCVLKQKIEPLLFKITNDQPQYAEARRLIKFLDKFLGLDSSMIPQNSILREFIG